MDNENKTIDPTFNPATDRLMINPVSDSVVLPPKAVEGLKPFQISAMKGCVYTIRNNSRIAGELVRSTASSLYDMKRNLVNKQWIAFLRSGALPIPEKQARDLVAAWEGWMSETDVTDGDLVGLGTRTLAKMKNLSPSDRSKVLKKKKEGETITEKYIDDLKKKATGLVTEASKDNSEEGTKSVKELVKINAELITMNRKMDKDIKKYIEKGLVIEKVEYVTLTPEQEKKAEEAGKKALSKVQGDPIVKMLAGLNQSRLKTIEELQAKVAKLEEELEFAKAGN